MSIETTVDDYGGTYKIKVKGTLDCLVISGLSNCKTSAWPSYINLNIVNVCSMANPCLYTTLEDYGLTTFVDMTVYVDGLEYKQTFTKWGDKVTRLNCESVSDDGCQTLIYSLIYADDQTTVESSLAVVISSADPPYIRVKTTTYDRCG